MILEQRHTVGTCEHEPESVLLARSMRTQADLVDQLFNSSEKRLARIFLLLAEMIGTTRSP
jgi:hypothetical protein